MSRSRIWDKKTHLEPSTVDRAFCPGELAEGLLFHEQKVDLARSGGKGISTSQIRENGRCGSMILIAFSSLLARIR